MMSAHPGCIEQSLSTQGNRNPQKTHLNDLNKMSHPISSCLYWHIELLCTGRLKHPRTPNKQPQHSTSEVLFSFRDNYSPHLATEKTSQCLTMSQRNSLPNYNFQIGSVGWTQLGLKYGNCISHYRAAVIVLGELLMVRRGCASGAICCADFCLPSRKKAPWRLDSRKTQEEKGVR